jgi:hypothetical protein
VSAAVLGGATLVTEAAAVMASARWIAEDRIAPVIETARIKIDTFKDKLNQLLPRIRPGRFIPNISESTSEGRSLPIAAQAAIVLNLGSVVLLEAKQRANPGRTIEQNYKDGMASAALVSGYMAIEGALIGTGMNQLHNPAYLTAAAVGIAGLQYGVHKLRQKTRQWVDTETIATESATPVVDGFRPRYDLTQEEMEVLDHEMVAAVKEVYPEPGVYAAIIEPDHLFSNFVRGHEAKFFPEAVEFPPELEQNTRSFALVDTRPASDRVVHVGSISGPGLVKNPETGRGDHRETTGFLSVDELVGLDNFTAEEFTAYYTERGLNLDKCIAVETNVKVGPVVEKYHGVRTVDLGYLTLVGMIEQANPGVDESAVFASINLPQALSFKRFGISTEPLMGRSDLLTPESFRGRVSTPVEIPYTEEYKRLFAAMGPQLPSVHFGTDNSQAR